MLRTLFDDETILRNHIRSQRRAAAREAASKAASKATQTLCFESVAEGEMRADYAARKTHQSVEEFLSAMRAHGYAVPGQPGD